MPVPDWASVRCSVVQEVDVPRFEQMTLDLLSRP